MLSSLAIPEAALAPFLDGSVEIVPLRHRADVRAPFRAPACVRRSAVAELGMGFTGGRADEWGVTIRLSDVPRGEVVLPGAVVLPGEGRPRLHVSRVVSNGHALHLDCTSEERAE